MIFDSEDFHASPIHYLESSSANPEHEAQEEQQQHFDSDQLKEGFAQLDARSQDIIKQRWLIEKKATLHELAAKYNVSAERVRQLETQAM